VASGEPDVLHPVEIVLRSARGGPRLGVDLEQRRIDWHPLFEQQLAGPQPSALVLASLEYVFAQSVLLRLGGHVPVGSATSECGPQSSYWPSHESADVLKRSGRRSG